MDLGNGVTSLLSVSGILGVEDKMWSTMWGIKGVVDVVVDVTAREAPGRQGGLARCVGRACAQRVFNVAV